MKERDELSRNASDKYGYEPGDPHVSGTPGQDMQHNIEVFAVQIGEPPGARVRYLSKDAAIGYLQPMWRDHQVGIEYMKDADCASQGMNGRCVIPIVTLESDGGQSRIGATLEQPPEGIGHS
ncbi:MAG: hypothetical protein BWY85_02413 [Firmicutes bacterium ADurb.Bin506]|jgi:hypothetical protein|nr:MAG: hypothetical protein BWY85_02413 [Firmicutes bacterium ADurb.Bin506]